MAIEPINIDVNEDSNGDDIQNNMNIQVNENSNFEEQEQEIRNTPNLNQTNSESSDQLNNEQSESEIDNTNNNEDGDDYDIEGLYNFFKDNNIVPDKPEGQTFENINDLANFIFKNNSDLIEQGVQSQLEQVNSTYRDLFNYVKNGGDVQQFVNNYSNSYNELDVKMLSQNIDLQKQVVKDYYRNTTNWNDNMIDKQLSKFDDTEIAEMSKQSLNTLKQIEINNKQQLIQQQQQQELQQKQYYDNLTIEYNKQLDELTKLGSHDITIKEKESIRSNLFNNVTYNKLSENFDKYRLNLAILDNYGLLDNPNALSEIIKTNKQKYNFKKKSTSKHQDNTGIDLDIITNQNANNETDTPIMKF